MQGSMQKVCNLMASHRTFLLGRSVNLQLTAGLKRSVEAKYGLPSKPVRPLSPYFRFLNQVRPNLVKANPNLGITDLAKVASTEWMKLNVQQKQQYETPYKKEWDAYLQAVEKYKKSLTEEQKAKIEEVSLELKEKKAKKDIKEQEKEHGKPKKFLGPFMIYLQENNHKRGSVPRLEWTKKLGEAWKKLSPAEKAKYETQSNKLRDEYLDSLKKWEDKMIRLGNLALVRNGVLAAKQAKAVATLKAKSTANLKAKSAAAKK